MNLNSLKLAKNLRKELHAHPEVSHHEVWTKKHLMDFLKKHTKLELHDQGNWFYAVYRSPVGKRNIAFRADFDALPMDEGRTDLPHGSRNPGVSHKCGHDGHSATLAAFALEIAETGCNNNIFFLFQHAEETGTGAIQCVDFIKNEEIDEIFAYHNISGDPLNTVMSMEGCYLCASKGMSIYLTGKPSHASQPERGINPSFAIAEIINAIPALVEPSQYTGMVLCTIIQVDIGEKAFGINASEGVLRMTIRALHEKEMDALQNALETTAKTAAAKYGLTLRFEFQDEFPETRNHAESVQKIIDVCQKKQITFQTSKQAFRGSEDFGHFLKQTKGAFFMVGNGTDYPSVHSYAYDFNEDVMETALAVFKGLAESD